MQLHSIRTCVNEIRKSLSGALQCLQTRLGVDETVTDVHKAIAGSDRLLRSLEVAGRQPDDCEYVRRQLIEGVSLHPKPFSEPHLYGSTIIFEPLIDVLFRHEIIEIDIETDALPVFVETSWDNGDIHLSAWFRLLYIERRPRNYLDRRSEHAFYSVELI